jgi:ribose-phosphate pyrophosphokinase
MSAGESKLVLAAGEFREPAERLAAAAGLEYAEIHVHRFPDGESLVRLPESLPQEVILYCSFTDPNRQLIELELMAATAAELGATRLILVAPYLCYMRQDKAFHPGEAVSQRIIGELLARHIDTLITVDPHLHRTHHLEHAVPVRRAIVISAAPLMTTWLDGRPGDPLIVGPDEESAQWVSGIAKPGSYDFCIGHKERFGDRQVRVRFTDCAFKGRDIVLVDDVVSTGQTIAEAAQQLVEGGAASIDLLTSHALFVDGTEALLQVAGVGDIISTDSIPHPSNQLHLDRLLADALVEH